MFDARNGKKVFNNLYKTVLDKNDPELWYEDGYCIWECWKFASGNALGYLWDGNRLNDEGETDLMAYIIECNPDDVATLFDDGFGFLLGQMMQNEYEMGE